MRKLHPFLLGTCFLLLSTVLNAQNEQFSKRVVNAGYNLNSAWEITYGPNDSLWVTENKAYLISRINIANGNKTVLLNLLGTTGDASINFSEAGSNKPKRVRPAVWPQGGLMGLALHPALFSTDPTIRKAKPWVYVAYVYRYINTSSCSGSTPCYFYTKIVRYTYNGNTLVNPITIIDSIPGSNDHNSGRLKIGPDAKLYYTIGDMGAGQFNNTSRTNNAQALDNLEGKIIRLNTEPDADAGDHAWIPNDNQFNDGGTVSPKDYVFSIGHRNAQGLDWVNINGADLLFSSEHGDKSDDEVNIIVGAKNYGWNRVSGYCDGNYDGKTLGGYSPVNEGAFCSTTPNNVEPIFTTFTATPAEISRFTSDMFSFKTIAPSSIEVYKSSAIPGWQNSVLVPGLKAGRVYRMKLDSTGRRIEPLASGVDTAAYFAGQGRFRDIAVSPDGLKIYVACDLSGATSGPTGGFNNKINQTAPPNAGKILEFRYAGGELIAAAKRIDYQEAVDQTATIKLYPNPATDQVIVEVGNAGLPVTAKVYDMVGKEIKSVRAATTKFDINLSDLPVGVYSIRVTDTHGKIWLTEKLIKQ